jgi:hypothetical protein
MVLIQTAQDYEQASRYLRHLRKGGETQRLANVIWLLGNHIDYYLEFGVDVTLIQPQSTTKSPVVVPLPEGLVHRLGYQLDVLYTSCRPSNRSPNQWRELVTHYLTSYVGAESLVLSEAALLIRLLILL